MMYSNIGLSFLETVPLIVKDWPFKKSLIVLQGKVDYPAAHLSDNDKKTCTYKNWNFCSEKLTDLQLYKRVLSSSGGGGGAPPSNWNWHWHHSRGVPGPDISGRLFISTVHPFTKCPATQLHNNPNHNKLKATYLETKFYGGWFC